MFQMVGYALLDSQDEFAIREVAFFNARYGHLACWGLQELLDFLPGRQVDLPTLRSEFARFLREPLLGG
ncbi:hypothetical protein ACQPW1_39340 [Nocardia sp. CA-128927]|uniref:hypothetical protein n=1 Tax=Nocardia sp. CA-128927 TaxID=3239975 RepID=UPI003D97E88A